MRIRTLLISMLISAMVLITLFFSSLWIAHDRLDTLLDTQVSSQSVAREVSALLVLTNEYALHGSAREVDQWRAHKQRIIDTLDATRSDDRSVIDALTEQVNALGSFFERLVDAKAGGDERLQQLRANVLMDQVLLKTQALFDLVDRWNTSTRLSEQALERKFHALVLALPIIVIILMLILTMMLSNRVLQPLSRLSQAVRAVAQGDLSVRTATTRMDEIGDVSRTFDALALDLVSQLRQEVAERRRAEGELKVQSARLQAILDAEPECVAILGPDFELLDINKSGLDWMELQSVEEAQQVGLRALIDPAHREVVLAMHRSAVLGNNGSLEFRLRGSRGTDRWVQAYVTPLTDAIGRMEVLWVSRDVTMTKQLTMELERQAHIDYLTQLNNRGHFMQLAETELSRSARYGGSISVLMLDVDYFKKINDTHGHKVGDQALIRLGEVCVATLRGFDIIGRMGGEEFAILLPQTGLTEALEVAERLRAAIGATAVAIPQGVPLHFTVSVGVAAKASPEENLDTLLSRADSALYVAKSSGRNCVRAAAPDQPAQSPAHEAG